MKQVIRPARASDKGPLMGFIKDVWGGHDYIPKVWDEWIHDRSAEMFVLELDGRPVAMNRVRLLDDGSAWLEGARVHPDHRRMGLARALGTNAMKVAKERKATVFRLTTGSRNRASQISVAGLGFREVGRFSVYEPMKGRRFRRHPEVRVATGRDLDSVTRSIDESREYRLGSGVLWDGFAAMSLTTAVVRKRLEAKSVYLCDGAVAIRVPGREGADVWNQIGFISGDGAPAMNLVDQVFATRGRFGWNVVMVPQGSPLVGALRRHGLSRSFSNVLFERKSVNG